MTEGNSDRNFLNESERHFSSGEMMLSEKPLVYVYMAMTNNLLLNFGYVVNEREFNYAC